MSDHAARVYTIGGVTRPTVKILAAKLGASALDLKNIADASAVELVSCELAAGRSVLLVGRGQAPADDHRRYNVAAELASRYPGRVFHVYLPESAAIAHEELRDAIRGGRDYTAEELSDHYVTSAQQAAPEPSSAPPAGTGHTIRIVVGSYAVLVAAPFVDDLFALRDAFRAILFSAPRGWVKYDKAANAWIFPPQHAQAVRDAIRQHAPGATVDERVAPPRAAPPPPASGPRASLDPVGDARKVLGLSERYTAEDLKKAYRRAALAAHPDRGGSHDAMTRVNVARDLLTR